MPTILLATDPSAFSPSGLPWGNDGNGNRFDNAGDVGTFTATGLAAGAYLLAIKYTESSNRTTGARHVILDGSTTLATIDVNQQNIAALAPVVAFDASVTYEVLGIFDLSSGTLVVQIHTLDSNYAIANTLWLERIGPAGTRTPVPPGFTAGTGTRLVYTPNAVDPSSATVFAVSLEGTYPGTIESPAADGFAGNVRMVRTLWGSAVTGTRQAITGARSVAQPFESGYYPNMDLGGGTVQVNSYANGSLSALANLFATTTFLADHLYRFTFDVSTSTKTILTATVADLTAGTYLTTLGTFAALAQPCLTLIDDPQTTGQTPIAGAGYSVFASYNQPLLDEGYSVAAVPMPGVAPYTAIYPDQFRFDAAGNVLQVRNPGFWWAPELRRYLMVGVDCSSGSVLNGGDFPAPGGVVLYSSPDFLNWTFVRKITGTTIGGTAYDWTLFPRIRRHPTNGNYYLFVESGVFSLLNSRIAILTASDPINGAWSVQNAGWNPNGDYTPNGFNLFEDSDGTTYLVFATSTDSTFRLAPLNSGWTDLAATPTVASVTGLPLGPASNRLLEATTLFKHGSTYIFGASYQTGWTVNPNQWAISSTLAGPYTTSPFAYVTSAVTGAANSYNTQVNDVFTTPAGDVILSADRFRPADFNASQHLLLKASFDGSGNPQFPWQAFVPAPPPGPTSVTLTGPTTGTVGVESTPFTATLDQAALAGGQVVSLASDGSGDAFHATAGGGPVTSITIPAGSTSGTFLEVAGTLGVRHVSIASAGLTVHGSPIGFTATPPTVLPWDYDLVAVLVASAEDADPFGVDASRTIEYSP